MHARLQAIICDVQRFLHRLRELVEVQDLGALSYGDAINFLLDDEGKYEGELSLL